MTFSLSPSAADRPKQTIHAAEMFHDNARSIASVCAEAGDSELVVAVVDADLAFAGVWTIPKDRLTERVPQLDNGGWTLVFAPRTKRDEIEDRSLRLARLAFARWEALRRWSSRNS